MPLVALVPSLYLPKTRSPSIYAPLCVRSHSFEPTWASFVDVKEGLVGSLKFGSELLLL